MVNVLAIRLPHKGKKSAGRKTQSDVEPHDRPVNVVSLSERQTKSEADAMNIEEAERPGSASATSFGGYNLPNMFLFLPVADFDTVNSEIFAKLRICKVL